MAISFKKAVQVDGGKTILIPFDKIFGNKDLEPISLFPINKKRNFIPITSEICIIINYVFKNKDEEIILDYMKLKTKIMVKKQKEKEYLEENFINDITVLLIKEAVIKYIDKYIEDSYTIELDKITSNNRTTINKELQFTDDHAKVTLKASMLMKYVIPIITTYISFHPVKSVDDLLYNIFSSFFKYFKSGEINILNKIFKLIESRITATRYSDQVIWSYLKNVSITNDNLTRIFNKKIISNVIPKIQNNKNVISFLHVVIKNLIMYQFTYNFAISYKPLNLNKTDSEGLSDFDKLEINMVRADESYDIINSLTIEKEIKFLLKKYDLKIGKSELEYYKSTIYVNKVQTNFLFLFFSKYTRNYRLLYNCNYTIYVKLLILFKKWLEKYGFVTLAKYITAVPEKITEKKTFNKRQILAKVLDFNKYEHLLKKKYPYIQDIIIGKSIIIKLIINLKYNKFFEIPTYAEYKKDSTLEKKLLSNVSDEVIINEVLNFCEVI